MTKFSDLKLDPKVLQAITEAGYETPTPIQAGAIPPALEGRDVLGIAQTGTGKTASFTLPMITLLGRGRARARMPRSLVLCPTRELAAQVAENFDTYAKHTKLTKALLIGGVSFGEQDKLIDRGVDVLIATPGRLLDHFERGKLLLTGVQIMVVDEADRMLDMGFIPDIERIFQLTPFTRQTLFFSATMAPEIERITDTFLHAPERIEVARQATTSETITQKLIEMTPSRRDMAAKQKRDLLRSLIAAEGEVLTNAIIFCNRKTDVDIVAKSLKKHGFDAAPIHGDLDQSQRTRTLEAFRDGKLRLLIASDVAARGLDIPAVSHVFNYDLPSHAEDYVHRIGRTGRAGRLGTAISISTPSDEKYLSAIENLVKKTLPRSDLPEGFTLAERDRQPREERNDARRDDRREDRRGGRDKRRRDRPDGADDVSRADVAPAPAPREDRAERNDNRRDDARREDRREDRRDERRGGRGRGRDDHRGPAIVGMGDHIPEFMLVELRPAGPMVFDNDADEVVEAPAEPAAARDDTRTDAPTKSRGSRSRGRGRDQAARDTAAAENVEATVETPVVPETPVVVETPVAEAPVAEQIATPADSTDAEAPAKPKRTRRKKTDADTQPAAADATEAAPKPRRSRKPAATAEAQASEDSATDAAPADKPKRTRRKKADADADTATATDAPAAPAKRTRRKKVDAAEQPADGNVPAEG